MAKTRETSTDKDFIDIGSEFSGGMEKKPNWVNLTQLDGPVDDSLANRLLYKPALRFHGLTGGLWGQGLSASQPVPSDPPPSYRFAESVTSRQHDGGSTSDIDTLYNTVNITAQSPLTLRRRNTMAVILVAIALLAAVAAVTGVILHFLHPKAMLRANVRFTIANRNYTEEMADRSSLDSHEIARPLCQEMDVYFLTSELADFYLGCNVVSMRSDTSRAKNGTEVHYTLDFIENQVSNDAERIKKIIMRKSGRHKTEDTLYLTIRDFLVYLRSLRVDVEVLPLPDDHPGRKHRPRIPWNDDIDFIARKSDDANNSRVNDNVSVDIEQLTNNLTETMEQITDSIFLEIPREVLPGGEINKLPILTPTPFHPNGTLHQRALALHLSSTAEQLPSLSHVFQNVSQSASFSVFNSNNQSVVYGSGAYINPSKASVYSSRVVFNNFRVSNIPTVQEVNVENGGVRVEKLRPPNIMDDKGGITHHDNMIGQIDASFRDVNDNNVLPEFTELQRQETEPTISEDLNQKIFTIFTDVFLIVGANTDATENNRATKETAIVTTTSTTFGSTADSEISVGNQPQLSDFLVEDYLTSMSISKEKVTTFKITTSSKENRVTEPPLDIANLQAVPDQHVQFDIASTSSTKTDSTEPKTDSMSESMQMNEMVVDLPTQEAAVPVEANVEWINMFNIPRKTMNVHVGDVKTTSSLIPGRPLIKKQGVERFHPVDNSHGNIIISHRGNSGTEDVNVILKNRKHTKITNTADHHPQVQFQSDILRVNEGEGLRGQITNSNGNENLKTSVVVRKRPYKFSTNGNGYYGPFVNSIGIEKPGITNAGTSLSIPSYWFGRINKSNMVPNSRLSPGGTTVGKRKENLRSTGNRNVFFNQQLLETGRHLDKVEGKSSQTHSTKQIITGFRHSVNRGKSAQKTNQQPWTFLNKIGVDIGLFERNHIRSRQPMMNNFAVRGISHHLRSHRGQKLIRQNRHPVWTGTQYPNNVWIDNYLFRFQSPVSVHYERRFYPALQMRYNQGLPKSPDFSDITDMKEILRQLVDNMYNMTTKIDHMQDAIDFINKTFHETHRPLFNLEETLENMTVSLGNLNQNLNSINATMKAFKDFLKQFGDTIFNIDDVIKHIDDTIGNLGNAVSYIEHSMTDLNGTVDGIAENVIDINKTLTHVNRSVVDVNSTANYSNRTLDSMKNTLLSLENAVSGLAIKVDIITDEADVLDISLNNINDTVKNTHQKLNNLHGKVQSLNSSMGRVENQIQRLNETYTRINKTLQNMNEPYIFVNGTVLEVIEKLATTDEQLFDLQSIMDIVNTNITSMNTSLLESMDWLDEMVQTLTDFNLWTGSSNTTITISLRNIGMIETVGMLLNMNGTLSEIGHKVDDINLRLDNVDQKLQYLEEQLTNLDKTLDNVDAKFKLLDKTLDTINNTVADTELSLNVINSTVQAMGPTFDKMAVSFGNINETLNNVQKTLTMINTTGTEINTTINSVNKTFEGLAKTINETTNSSKMSAIGVSNFTGSLHELNSQLYNANESLRITKSKADIAIESYRLLNETIAGVSKTLTELQTKIVETNQVLQHTNTSLTHVNDSLLGMETSFQSLQMELADVQNSFIHMRSSMQGFGSAFPNIQNSIQEAQYRMSDLQLNITDIDTELQTHKVTRDVLVGRHERLQGALASLSNTMNLIRLSCFEIANFSRLIYNEILLLNESVNEAIDIYNKTERNIKYINETHEELKEKYFSFLVKANATNSSLTTVKQDMESLRTDFEELGHIVKEYINIDVHIDSVLTSFNAELLRHQATNDIFRNRTKYFRSLDQLLWDEHGDPQNVHVSFQELVNSTELMNKTQKMYEEILNKTDKVADGIAEINNDMRTKLRETYKLRNKIDVIETKEDYLNEKISEKDKQLKHKQHQLSVQSDVLNEKLDTLQNLWKTFGDVNGTFESETLIQDLENKIKTALGEQQETMGSLNEINTRFNTIVDRYKSANSTYHKSNFNLSPESNDILDSTLTKMEETERQIAAINIEFKVINNSFDDTEDKINTVGTDLENLEKILLHQNKKNTFITANRPKIEHQFNNSFHKYNEIENVQNILLRILGDLQDTSVVIDEKVGDSPNINISTLPEKEIINQLLTELRYFDVKLIQEKDNINVLFREFVQYEEANKTLQQVKETYDKYSNAVKTLEHAVQNVSLRHSEMFHETKDISDIFDYILQQINDYRGLDINITKSNDSLQILNSKLGSISATVSEAADQLFLLKLEFDDIKLNYTNFTATDINLTESYIVEAINDVDSVLLNVTAKLQHANVSVLETLDMFQDTRNIYMEKQYDRTDIEITIHNLILPNLKEISERYTATNEDLDSINSVISNIELSLKGIDEIMHSTNKQLSIDRHKQLLADTTFPDLVSTTEYVNKSISSTSDLLEEGRTNLERTMVVVKQLKERLEDFPTVNIALNEYDAKLMRFNDTLDTLFERVRESSKRLSDANKTIWIEDGERYLNNETIRDVKTRYKTAEDMLNDILTDLTDVNAIIESVVNGTNRAFDELSSINVSLHDLDSVNNEVQNLLQDLPFLDLEINKTNSNINSLENDFASVNETFTKIKTKFSEINADVYNRHVVPFHEDNVRVAHDIDNLGNATDSVGKKFIEARKLSNLLKQINSKTYTSKEELESVISLKEIIIKNISKILDEIKFDLNEIENNASFVEPNIRNLDIRLHDIERVFRDQEKTEYFEEHFPGKNYESLNATINDVKIKNDLLGSYAGNVKENLQHLKQTIGNHSNIYFDTSPTESSLAETVEIVDGYRESIENISTEYLQLKLLLRADDGLLISDIERIDEMKKRYEIIDTSVQKMNTSLHDMNITLSQRNIWTEKNNDNIQEMQSLLITYTEVSENINSLHRRVKQITKTADTLGNLHSERENLFHEKGDEYFSIISSFNGTTNDLIKQLKMKVERSLIVLEERTTDLRKTTDDVHYNISNFDMSVSNYSKKILGDHFQTETLERVLLDFKSINGTLGNEIDSTYQTISTFTRNAANVDNSLMDFTNDIDRLKQLLTEQEEQDYIKENGPKLLHLLQQTKDDINQTKERFQKLTENSKVVSKLYKSVQNTTAREPTINISLAASKNVIVKVGGAMPRFENILDQGNSVVNDIDTAMFDMSGTHFKTSDTIEDIKQAFENLNNTLKNVRESMNTVINEEDEYLNHLNIEHSFLSSLDEEARKLNAINSNHMASKEDVKQLGDNLDIIKLDSERLTPMLINLEENLKDISRIYVAVEEPSLHHELSLLFGEISNLKKEHMAISTFIGEIGKSYNDTVIQSEQLGIILTNISATIEELRTKIVLAGPVYDEISNDVLLVNTRIVNVTDPVEVILETVPKTNKSITELREKFRRQQIYEFIKENFPTLLAEYANVNRTLNSLDITIPDILSKLENLKSSNNDFVNALEDLELFHIPYDDAIAEYKHYNSTLEDVVSKGTDLEERFNAFEEVITSNFDSNETLQDIKKRFATYETTLHDMNENLEYVLNTLNRTDAKISEALNQTKMHKDALNKYRQVLKIAQLEDLALEDLENILNETYNELELVTSAANSQSHRLDVMENRFRNVNSSEIDKEKSSIKHNLNSIVNDISNSEDMYLGMNNQFETLSNTYENVQLLFNPNMSSMKQLESITREATTLLDNLSQETQTVYQDTKSKIKPSILAYKPEVSGLKNNIDTLQRLFIEKEKLDYITTHIPRFKTMYEHLELALFETSQRIPDINGKNSHFNHSIVQLQQRIDAFHNINIPTEYAVNQNELLHDNITIVASKFNRTSDLFENLDSSIFQRTDWSNFSLDSVKQLFGNLTNDISSINKTILDMNKNIDKFNVTIGVEVREIDHSNVVLDRYMESVNVSATNENDLQQLSYDLDKTLVFLEDIKRHFYHDGDRLSNLTTKQFPEVTSSQIEQIINETRTILEGKVGLRIPLLNKLFAGRLMKKYHFVQDRLNDAVSTLNETYTATDDLENTLGDVEDTLNNVTLETEYMVNSEEFYREDAIPLSELLNESSVLLDKLEEMFKVQSKIDMLNAILPDLKNSRTIQVAKLRAIYEDLNATSVEINYVTLNVDHTDHALDNITTVTIPTVFIRSNLTFTEGMLKALTESASDIDTDLYQIFNPDIDINVTATNKSVSVSDVQEQLEAIQQSLQQSNEHITHVENNVTKLKHKVSSTKSSVELLNDTLSQFKTTEDRMKKLGNTLNKTTAKLQDTSLQLETADTEVTRYNKTLNDMRQKYEQFAYDSDDIELFLRKVDTNIDVLNKTLYNYTSLLSDADTEYNNTSGKLYTETDSVVVLNETLEAINSALPRTNSTVAKVNKALDDMRNSIPDLNIDLKALNGMLQQMNESLMNEDNKSSFAENALPVLKEKYKITNKTFEKTNATLKKMADELEWLNNYIETLKGRMSGFSTINISMSDIDANITHLENRLVIMQDHYNNVKDIVDKFQKDLRVNHIFGRNISLSDVEDQYKSFNDTLDLINGVLKGIDSEAYEMEEHFGVLNDTMYKIDNALDRFERKQIDTKIIGKEIELLELDIIKTNDSVNEMQTTVKLFSQSFDDMRVLYADVINSTAKNNTVVNDLLTNMNQSLAELKELVGKLDTFHVKNNNDFLTINETLFRNIDTYEDLNNTLDDVKNKLLQLSKFIHKLQRDVDNVKQDTLEKKSSIAEINKLLVSLNGTLYNEQVKYDFIKNNLGNLEDKFATLKSPIESAKQTLGDVNENINNASDFVNSVDEKLNLFSNVHISLEKDMNKLTEISVNVSNIEGNLHNISVTYDNLQKNFTTLDERTGDMGDIVGKYKDINETLDGLQDNLTDMLNALYEVNLDTNDINDRTETLDSSLDKLSRLNTSASSISTSFDQVGNILANTNATLTESVNSLDELKQMLNDMERVHRPLDDKQLLDSIFKLMENVNQTKDKVVNVKTMQNDLHEKEMLAVRKLEDTHSHLNDDIINQTILDKLNTESEKTLTSLWDERDEIVGLHNATDSEANDLQNIIAILTDEILMLNDTLSEEKRKKDFIANNFPEIEDRYISIQSSLDSSSKDIRETNKGVDNVAKGLSDVKERLENLTAIAIPLDSENKEVLRVRTFIQRIEREFKNASAVYDGLKFEQLSNLSMGFDNLKEVYAGFDKSLRKIEKTINNINSSLDEINGTISVIKDSAVDINSTIDEYIATGKRISDVFDTGSKLSTNIGNTNETIEKLNNEIHNLSNSLQDLLSNYNHIQDQDIVNAQSIIQDMLESSKGKVRNLSKNITDLGIKNKNSHSMIEQMNNTYTSTKHFLEELKKHIKDVTNMSSSTAESQGNTEFQRKGVNQSATSMTPELESVFDNISQLTDKYMKEQEKLDLISANKPVIDKRLKDLQKPLEETHQHISLVEVKLADLKYSIVKVGSRLDKFKTLNVTTEQELQQWDKLHQDVENISNSFKNVSEQYKRLQGLVKTIEDRNITIEEMKKKFSDINNTLDGLEYELDNLNTILTNIENAKRDIEKVLDGLEKSMDNFKSLQNDAAKTTENIHSLQTKIQNVDAKVGSIVRSRYDIKNKLEVMNSSYGVLNSTRWNAMLPKLTSDLKSHGKTLKDANKTVETQREKLKRSTNSFDSINSEINNKHLSRQNVVPVISSLRQRLNTTSQDLKDLKTPLDTVGQTLNKLKKTTDATQKQVHRLNTTLHKELMKHNYVEQNLPYMKEKHSLVNKSYIENIPTMESMQGQIANLLSIIQKIKDKMRHFGLDDTDNSIKKWDVAIQKLNTTVAAIMKKNQVAGKTLEELRSKLWSNDSMYTSEEPLSDLMARFEGYNKTLDEMNSASHTINIKLADLDSAASSVIGKLMERDAILTTTPATTTPSGPPEWLSFYSTESGEIGKDPGMAECAVEDMSKWNMMKITRINKDGREEAIGAWKLGAGARKAVRDRRIRVRRTKTATGGKLTVGIKTLQCEDEGTYYCSIDSYSMWPLETTIGVVSPPEDNLKPDFPTEVFEDKVANFSCTGHPGYPSGRLVWKIKREQEADFRPFDFYSSKAMVTDTSCERTETNKVEYQFDLQWNNTQVRCYIENTNYYAEGIIRLLPYDICNKVRYLGTISHPYTPHKYIVCGKELNIMQCPGNTCYDEHEENCVRCKAGHAGGGDPCHGQPLFSYVAHEKDCKKYYICMGPTKTTKKCTKGYFAPNIPGNCVMSYAQSHCGRKAG